MCVCVSAVYIESKITGDQRQYESSLLVFTSNLFIQKTFDLHVITGLNVLCIARVMTNANGNCLRERWVWTQFLRQPRFPYRPIQSVGDRWNSTRGPGGKRRHPRCYSTVNVGHANIHVYKRGCPMRLNGRPGKRNWTMLRKIHIASACLCQVAIGAEIMLC